MVSSDNKYGSNVSFIDLLFNVLVGFVFLFVVAFIMINPVAKRADIVTPAEFLITMSWPDESKNDVDLWVRDPMENYIGFRSKDVGITNLDRDDLGSVNDKVSLGPGKEVVVNINREVTSIRGLMPGQYIVSIHLYNYAYVSPMGIPVTIELQKINPYAIITKETRILSSHGQIEDVFSFVIDENGKVVDISPATESAVPLHNLPAPMNTGNTQ